MPALLQFWSIACRRCSNYISILDLIPGFNGWTKTSARRDGQNFPPGEINERSFWSPTPGLNVPCTSFIPNHSLSNDHADVIKWKYFPRYWPFVRGIHRSPVNSHHKGQWCGTLMFSLICAWTNGWVNNRYACDLKRHCAHCNVTLMSIKEIMTWINKYIYIKL